MTTQRGKQGNGSLVEVRPGVWRSRVVTGYVNGKAQQHSETYGGRAGSVTKREATSRHAAHVAAVGAGTVSRRCPDKMFTQGCAENLFIARRRWVRRLPWSTLSITITSAHGSATCPR